MAELHLICLDCGRPTKFYIGLPTKLAAVAALEARGYRHVEGNIFTRGGN